MIKKYKCSYCKSYFTQDQLDGGKTCPDCFEQIDKKKYKTYAQTQEQEQQLEEDDDDNYDQKDNYYGYDQDNFQDCLQSQQEQQEDY